MSFFGVGYLAWRWITQCAGVNWGLEKQDYWDAGSVRVLLHRRNRVLGKKLGFKSAVTALTKADDLTIILHYVVSTRYRGDPTKVHGKNRMSKRKPKVVVVGSFMMDLVIKAERRPQKGETLIGQQFGMFGGGKGNNQAIAAARLGGDVTMVGRLGRDSFGDTLMDALVEEGVEVGFVVRDGEAGTGVASPVIDADGDNSIIIVPRANMRLSTADVERAASVISESDVLLLQLEVPISASQCAAEIAQSSGTKVILNPAPARDLPDSFLSQVDILTPNQVETEFLSGEKVSDSESAERAAKILLDRGVSAVILTLGDSGALLVKAEMTTRIPAYTVNVVDTTAAGDAFCGALAIALARGETLEDRVVFANAAGALAVTALGAAPSMPTATQICEFLAS